MTGNPVAGADTLDGIFAARVRLTPGFLACRHYDEAHRNWRDYTWEHLDHQVARWQEALEREGLKPGDRVAIMLRNCPEWVIFDQAALGLGLIVVPLYTQDRADNIAYILDNAECRLLLVEGRGQWDALKDVIGGIRSLTRVVVLVPVPGADAGLVATADEWLPPHGTATRHVVDSSGALATIVYTSGTTGRPKGVMLSHRNIVSNVEACLGVLRPNASDMYLSFLPLSHMFERTCGYYLGVMTGAPTAYARSVHQLGDDLQTIRPTLLVSVPRIYEKVLSTIRAKLADGPRVVQVLFDLAVSIGYARFQWQQGQRGWDPRILLWPVLRRLVAGKVLGRLGGRIRAAISGGAALHGAVSRVFIGLGLPLVQGYGMTELSPVACANRPRDNVPESVGAALPGVEVRLGADGGLQVKGPNVMLGYWRNDAATAAILDSEGWLSTGDMGRIDETGRVSITGRLKEIIVMSNGEKVPPLDMESAILRDPLFEQVMLLGEGKPYLTAMAVLQIEEWKRFASMQKLDPGQLQGKVVERAVLSRISAQIRSFPGYAQVRRVYLTIDPWTINNGLMTPTLKLRRAKVMERFNAEIDAMYQGR